MPEIKPSPEMTWLLGLVGTWTWRMPSGDGGAIQTGTETVTAVGEAWIIIQGEFQGSTNVFQFGYDPAKEKIVGTFICSVMQYLWTYEGVLDGNRMVMMAEGPRLDGKPGLMTYRDTFTLTDPNRRTLTSEFLDDAGAWTPFMSSEYTRQ